MPTPLITRRINQLNWLESVDRSRGNRPMLRAEFVAELGRDVRLIDVRASEELIGNLGHLPGSYPVPLAEIHTIPELLGLDAPVVLVCDDGERSSAAALYLERVGMKMVAALLGGVRQWRDLGFSISRRTIVFDRRLDQQLATPPGQAITPDCRLTTEQVAWHVGQPGSVRWVKFAALMLHGKTACIDGRDDRGVIGTPGGDAGEFTLALAAVEQLSGVALDEARVAKLLEAWLDTFGRFYMHTDVNALNAMIKAFRADARIVPHLDGVFHPPEWRAFMRRPPVAVREALLEHLVNPQHVGCGHLRLSMQSSADYGLRREAADAFLRAFFLQRWGGTDEAEYVVLGGDHGEGAIMLVTLEEELYPHTKIPLISPAFEGLQMFVLHPQIAAQLRRFRAGFLVSELAELELDVGALGDLICALGKRQLDATVARLAAGLPVYEVRFDRSRAFTVTQVA
ncbi:MAG TPA: rhodanese-like domain-containing protein [Enhygromyxa sp.]|nr:rhodanese-like domain-containing protein [Enhygromyxa sp.]